eukprot:12926638-Alexandrium_andersonii.AAC.1
MAATRRGDGIHSIVDQQSMPHLHAYLSRMPEPGASYHVADLLPHLTALCQADLAPGAALLELVSAIE